MEMRACAGANALTRAILFPITATSYRPVRWFAGSITCSSAEYRRFPASSPGAPGAPRAAGRGSWNHLVFTGAAPHGKGPAIAIVDHLAVADGHGILQPHGAEPFGAPGILKSEDAAAQVQYRNVRTARRASVPNSGYARSLSRGSRWTAAWRPAGSSPGASAWTYSSAYPAREP